MGESKLNSKTTASEQKWYYKKGEVYRNRWIDYSVLPNKGIVVDWKNCVGCFCSFKYDDIEDVFKIVGYDADKMIVTIDTPNYGEYSLSTDALRGVNIAPYIGRFKRENRTGEKKWFYKHYKKGKINNNRWIDYSSLPDRGKIIDWKNSIGCLCSFKYDDIEDVFKIVDYDADKMIVTIDINKYGKHSLTTDALHGVQIAMYIGKFKRGYRYNIGDIVNDIEIVGLTRVGKVKNIAYNYKCTKCPNKDVILQTSIANGSGCNVCCPSSQKVLREYNDIATTHPHLIDYFVDINDCYNNTAGSNKLFKMNCPYCKTKKTMTASTLSRNGFSCPKCSDGKSIPERYMASVLTELGIIFKNDCITPWSQNKRYDFKFQYNYQDYIIECHGIQHYSKGFEVFGGRTLEEEKENDEFKKQLALENGIKEENYIIVDCRESTFHFLTKNIIKELSHLFNLCNIDFEKCYKESLSSLVIKVINSYNEGITNTNELSEKYNIARKTVGTYLKVGADLKLCDYDPNSIREELKKPIICIDQEGNTTFYESILECSRRITELTGTKYLQSNIHGVLKGCYRQYLGLTFRYHNENEVLDVEKVLVEAFAYRVKPYAKKILCIGRDGSTKIYDSITGCADELTLLTGETYDFRNIQDVAKGNRRRYKDYTFKYYNENEDLDIEEILNYAFGKRVSPKAKQVVCIDSNENVTIYESATKCAQQLTEITGEIYNQPNISAKCNGKDKTNQYKDYEFYYLEDYEKVKK